MEVAEYGVQWRPLVFSICNSISSEVQWAINELFAKYNYNDQVKEEEIGRACRIHGGEAECI
jgi:hypothetical protein